MCIRDRGRPAARRPVSAPVFGNKSSGAALNIAMLTELQQQVSTCNNLAEVLGLAKTFHLNQQTLEVTMTSDRRSERVSNQRFDKEFSRLSLSLIHISEPTRPY
eukprot:TRINITY_DN18152_c0_g1_i1.p1 TRINITY_DN18152_c0_g1~~TRINITY_DN18152_c0_g1_i1.p1  ORF type:complete len:104 (+),score=22.47 TRINITY_DN18152_c0_g1_i1:107-418(+)